ncbi:Gfo/Idh/MocA family oxidoreductase [candidate division KSB1 bacterium]|nr:Gfo/Idh/MocA family oxidoreductase [candidate division KSB1 bacterium]
MNNIDRPEACVTRRDFMKSTTIVGLSMAGAGMTIPVLSNNRILGANDTVRVGIAGLRVKGAQHIDVFREIPNVRVAAICDVDTEMLAREKAKFTSDGETVDTMTDIRQLLDRKDIDAIVVSSPNHWHSLMGIWACQAGKDVYVEKPVSHNVWEGRQLVKASKKYNRIVQAGIQKRSDTGLVEAFNYIREGHLGRITLARGLCYKRRKSIGLSEGPQPIPKNIDYNLWTGPAKLGPLMRKSLHYDWHWQWETGNGDIGNQGIHEIDMCRWVMDETGLPKSVTSFGGRYGYIDDGETPNTQISLYEYDTAPLIFEVRGLPQSPQLEAMDAYKGVRIGVVIHCEHGYFAGGDGGGWVYDNDGNKIQKFVGSGGVKEHAANFIQAIRDRDSSALNGQIEDGHISSALCHLANISYCMGTLDSPESLQKNMEQDSDILDAFDRTQEHLMKNDVQLDKRSIRMGPKLMVAPGSETFVSNEEFSTAYFANLLLRREYREPFVVSEID